MASVKLIYLSIIVYMYYDQNSKVIDLVKCRSVTMMFEKKILLGFDYYYITPTQSTKIPKGIKGVIEPCR